MSQWVFVTRLLFIVPSSDFCGQVVLFKNCAAILNFFWKIMCIYCKSWLTDQNGYEIYFEKWNAFTQKKDVGMLSKLFT